AEQVLRPALTKEKGSLRGGGPKQEHGGDERGPPRREQRAGDAPAADRGGASNRARSPRLGHRAQRGRARGASAEAVRRTRFQEDIVGWVSGRSGVEAAEPPVCL